MIELNEIDHLIEKLLDYLESIQNEDGSFDSMCFQPTELSTGWIKWERNAPVDTASTLMPLLFLDSKKASLIIERGIKYILKTSLDQKVWRYTRKGKVTFPYDIDSTAQCSYILTQNNYKVNNKDFLNLFINNQNHYDLFLFPKGFTTKISLPTLMKIIWHNTNSTPTKIIGITKKDWDFGTTCNYLLYIGKCEENYHVWNEIKKNFDDQTIETCYYNTFSGIHAYSRLVHYGNYEELRPTKEVIEKCFRLHENTFRTSFLDQLLFVNALLFLDYDFHNNKLLLDQCILDIHQEKYKEDAPYYSSNTKLTIQPQTKQPLIYFAPSSIACTSYLEFLNLYRKKYHNAYYKLS